MKTTARTITGCVAFMMGLSAAVTIAGPLWPAAEVLLGTASSAQAVPSAVRPADKRQQTDDLLRRARQAMAEDNLEAAASLVSAAEAIGVQYNLLHLGDTPRKVRRDLTRKRNAAKKAPTRPSQLFSQLSLRKKEAPRTDPFAGRSPESLVAGFHRSGDGAGQPASGTGPPSPQQVTRLPDLGFTNPVRPDSTEKGAMPLSPFGRMIAPTPSEQNDIRLPAALTLGGRGPSSGSDVAAEANRGSLLLQSRRALALGDVKRAISFLNQAKQQQRNYGPLDDTPQQVEAAIRKYQDLSARPDNTEAYRRGRARMWMEQAEALFRAGDSDLAEQLAGQAARQQLTYGPFEAKPDDLLKRIADARRQHQRPASSLPRPTAAGRPAYAPALSLAARKRQADELTRQARVELGAGKLIRAELLARKAEALGVPDSAYAPNEDRAGLVLFDIRKAGGRTPSGVVQAGAQLAIPATGALPANHTASPAWYDPQNDPTRNVPAAHQPPGSPGAPRQLDFAQDTPVPAPVQRTPPPPVPASSRPGPQSLFQQGETALKAHDKERAYGYFRQANEQIDQLDPVTAARLRDYLQLLSMPSSSQPNGPAGSIVGETAAGQQVLLRQVSAEVAQQAAKAGAMLATDPKGALALLRQTRKNVESAGLEPAGRQRLLRRVDRHLAETQQFIEQNRPRIELEEKNRQTRDQIQRERHVKIEIQEKLALMVDQFNRLMDEQRFEEAEVVAKRAAELDPENPLIQQLRWQSTFVRRFRANEALRAQKEQGFVAEMFAVERASTPFNSDDPYIHGDVKEWEQLTNRRRRFRDQHRRNRTEADLEIERKLRHPVSLSFKDEPLSSVLEHLAELTAVNIVVDPQGLAEYGVTTDTPVTIEVRNQIMLKSALNLILEPLQLSYVIKDEVLKITSEQQREGEVYTETYSVADLVVPIPNFIAGDMGLASAYHGAMGNVGYGGGSPFGLAAPPLAVVASKDGSPNNAAINPALLAQISQPGSGMGAGSMPVGFGPGGLGGGSAADFDQLIELITSTIQPESWDEVGGPGSIASFETNLSLVVSQRQDVHEEIVDLLQQLRRMQDLQVTIEVRFITLNDNFFERIGVDFDFDIDDNIDRPFQVWGRQDPLQPGDPSTGTEPGRNTLDVDNDRSVTVGMQSPGVFSADLDIPFTQNSFSLAVPQFGGFDAAAGAQLGFAILSDIEAFFFISAAQGDRRSNVLQAPKVTLFNGQQAFVSDQSQSPFVISVIPVVGDFAAAQQPVIVVLSEGTFMTVQAVVSDDRRFVRLTVVPFFSKIGDVQTFQFTGSDTTTTDTSSDSGAVVDPNDPTDERRNNVTGANNSTRTTSGTTVQLPTFSFVTVTTTVSVPDGGTVLLGGIKRLSEGRNEFGVPILAKIPYINRLFKNVGIGRETQSLMMMVTPRIIIQEEEEERLGITPP